MTGEWKRPESVPYPQVWSKFEGKRKINGKVSKFWIQDVPQDMYKTVADFMCSNYNYEEPRSKYSRESLNKIVNTVKYLLAQKDVYDMIGDDKYLTAIGRSVLPEFRGQGISKQLLLAKTSYCKALCLKSTFTIFISSASQKLVERTGFKDVVNISYEELEKVDSNFLYPKITEHTKNI